MPAEISIPIHYAVPVLLGSILFLCKIKTLWHTATASFRWMGRNFITLVLIGFILSVIVAAGLPLTQCVAERAERAKKNHQKRIEWAAADKKNLAKMNKTIKERERQSEADKKARIEAHLHSILPGRWHALHAEASRVTFWETKFALVERFIDKYAENEPKIPPEGLNKLLKIMDGQNSEASIKRIKRLKDILYPYMDFVVEKEQILSP